MISIIIPVYNHSETLPLVLESIVKQSLSDFEVIIVDDGSDIPVTIDSQLYTFSVTCIRQNNAGAPVARNIGFKKSIGQYVIFWDADIIADPIMLKEMLEVLESQKEVSFVYGNFYFGNTFMRGKDFSRKALEKNNYIPVCSLLRREDFSGFDPTLKRFQDWDLWLTLTIQGKRGKWIDKVLFRTVQAARIGISDALPSYAYTFPFKYLPPWRCSVQKYQRAKKIVQAKHGI